MTATAAPQPHKFEPLENNLQCAKCYLMEKAGCHSSMSTEKQPEKCDHYFQFSNTQTEATQENYIYHRVAYSVCVKCGEVRKNKL